MPTGRMNSTYDKRLKVPPVRDVGGLHIIFGQGAEENVRAAGRGRSRRTGSACRCRRTQHQPPRFKPIPGPVDHFDQTLSY